MMDLGLDGRVALVTGGSRGIGAAVSLVLGRLGCDVALTYRGREQAAKEVARQIEAMGRRALAIQADVGDFDGAERTVQTVVDTLGRLDILVCNAGITWDGVIWKMSEQQWDAVIDTNLKGYFNYNRAAARVFKDARYGKIVNIASINGLRGKFAQSNYSASKAGNIALSKALAKELGKFNVNVNCVAPGMVMTEMAESIPPAFLNAATSETVLGRIASSEDVAHVVAFLCSDFSRHVTGEVIKVDGGQYI
ncbi:MAG: SDR family NAD(P)-dependent oxidoreductase [Candidatus Eiseniibacteriota bacterium]|jgi:3-oxoacyl-[acyl-carrier protein] reductase